MPLREDILAPIPGENPSGIDLRYDNKASDLRQDQGGPAPGRRFGARGLAERAKDGQFSIGSQARPGLHRDRIQGPATGGCGSTEALLQTEGYCGLARESACAIACYPSSGKQSTRSSRTATANFGPAALLDRLRLDVPLRSVPLTVAGIFLVLSTRTPGTWAMKTRPREKRDRRREQNLIEEGKIAPEIFDKSFAETPKAFYLQAEKDLDACLHSLEILEELLR